MRVLKCQTRDVSIRAGEPVSKKMFSFEVDLIETLRNGS